MTYRDPTPLDPNKDYTAQELAEFIRRKLYGVHTREAMARSLLKANEVAEWSRDVAQQIIDGAFDEGELNTEIERRLNELEQKYAPKLTQVSDQLAEVANLGNYQLVPIYDSSGRLSKIEGANTELFYNQDGTLRSVSEIVLGKKVINTLNYIDGSFAGITRQVEGDAPIEYPDTLIGSIDNMLLSHSGDMLLLSKNGGKSYDYAISTEGLGIIKYLHIFRDGSLMFCTDQKCYYTHDWLDYHESTVLDINGDPFVPSKYDNFTLMKKNKERQIVNGKEMLVWGNYSNSNDTQYENINVWYTLDKGKTIKSCYKFGEGGRLSCRHVHNVDFNPADQTFYVLTGDEYARDEEQSHVIKGIYDMDNDSWEWELIGSGNDFKWSNIQFCGSYVYYSWDRPKGGVRRVLYSQLPDVSKHEQIISSANDCIGIYIGKNGDMIAFQSVYGGGMQPRNFYYSPDRVNFHRIEGEIPSGYDHLDDAMYYAFWGPNDDGKILAGIRSASLMPLHEWDRKPSVFVDDFIRRNGFPDAFK